MKRPARKPWHVPIIISVITLAMFGIGWWLLDGQHISVLMPSGEVGSQQRDLIIFTVLLALIVVVPVFTMLGLFAWKFREGNKEADHQPEWADNKWLEIIWWGIPILIIIVLAIVTWRTSHLLDPYRPIESDKTPLKVQVVALQWKWLFIYPEEKIATINDLTIPVDRPVHFTLSADAPMSAFWIPDLGSQIYSMNAMSSQLNLIANREGTFTGYNTNINGDGYAAMKFQTHAVSDGAYDTWVKKHQGSHDMLTYDLFQKIAEPNIPERPTYYMLHEDGLYDRIVHEKMGHGSSHGNHDSTGEDSRPILDPSDGPPQETDTMEHMNHDHGGAH